MKKIFNIFLIKRLNILTKSKEKDTTLYVYVATEKIDVIYIHPMMMMNECNYTNPKLV